MGHLAPTAQTLVLRGSVDIPSHTTLRLNDSSEQSFPSNGLQTEHLATTLRPIYSKLISDLNLEPLERFESEKLMKTVLEAAEATGVPCLPNSHSYESLLVGYSYADNCFPYHSLEVKVFVAIYTWLATLCDDVERVGDVKHVELFQQRWILGEDQPTTLLRAFAAQIRLAYKYYHPLVANLIVNSSFYLMTATALTAREGVKDKTKNPSNGGQLFPWYIRERDGVGEGYAWFTFPKDEYADLDVPIEAMEDMARFIAFGNDVLSFYKEELAEEKDNYIHKKANCDGNTIFATLKQTAEDTISCAKRIEQVLAGKGKYERAWLLHKTGYIHMHTMRSRYRLFEMGIGDKPGKKEVLKC